MELKSSGHCSQRNFLPPTKSSFNREWLILKEIEDQKLLTLPPTPSHPFEPEAAPDQPTRPT